MCKFPSAHLDLPLKLNQCLDLPLKFTNVWYFQTVKSMRSWFYKLHAASLDKKVYISYVKFLTHIFPTNFFFCKIKMMEKMREEARENPGTNTALLKICALEVWKFGRISISRTDFVAFIATPLPAPLIIRGCVHMLCPAQNR